MSLEQHAFMHKPRVPSREAWQAAVDPLGFDFQIDHELKPFESSGFLPCKLNGKLSGFEIYYDEAADLLETYPNPREDIGTRDVAISFRFGSYLAECVCVLIAAAALAKSFDAVVYDPQDDCIWEADHLLKEAQEILRGGLEDAEPPPLPRPRSLVHRLSDFFARRKTR